MADSEMLEYATEQPSVAANTSVIPLNADAQMPLRSSGSGAEPDAATEHIAVEAEASMSMEDIVAELSAHSTDDARDVINAAQTILKGNQKDIRNLCHAWGVQLKSQKRHRPTETIKQELKMSLTKRAMELKRKTDASAGEIAEPPDISASASNFPDLFGAPDELLCASLRWAHSNASDPDVAAWLEACRHWDAAIAAGESTGRAKRRKLCKDHGIALTIAMESSGDDARAERTQQVRKELADRIKLIRDNRAAFVSLRKKQSQDTPTTDELQSGRSPIEARTPESKPLQQSKTVPDVAADHAP